MTERKINLPALAAEGSKKVKYAFYQMSKMNVDVSVVESKEIEINEFDSIINNFIEGSIVVASNIVSGVDGMSILCLQRGAALQLVDVLNQVKIGTTGVLKEIDRSAIKETLNILGNSFINAYSKFADQKIILSPPQLYTTSRVSEIFRNFKNKISKQSASSLMFSLKISIIGLEVEAKLYLIFREAITAQLKEAA